MSGHLNDSDGPDWRERLGAGACAVGLVDHGLVWVQLRDISAGSLWLNAQARSTMSCRLDDIRHALIGLSRVTTERALPAAPSAARQSNAA